MKCTESFLFGVLVPVGLSLRGKILHPLDVRTKKVSWGKAIHLQCDQKKTFSRLQINED
jgi:hypothetical protein